MACERPAKSLQEHIEQAIGVLIRCYEKCGFVREGVERESAWVDGAWADDVLMAILEHEYRALASTWAV